MKYTNDKDLNEICIKYNLNYKSCLEYKDDIKNIFNNPINKLLNFDHENDLLLLCGGIYYEKIVCDYEKAIKYYKMSIEKDNSEAMFRLGLYYQLYEYENNLLIKYYEIAINKKHNKAMNNLGLYYYQQGNYKLAKENFLLATEYLNDESMLNLGMYYKIIEDNNELTKKYFLMAIDNFNSDAMYELGKYYIEKEYNALLMKKYFSMAISYNNYKPIEYLNMYYKTDLMLYYKFLITIDTHNDIKKNKINELILVDKNILLLNYKYILFSKLNNYTKCFKCEKEDILCVNNEFYNFVCIDCYDDK